jgi:hypothetical protein
MDVEVPTFDNPQVMEKINRTCFLFGFRDQAGNAHKVASKWMKISGHQKAKLMEFLGQCLGKPFPLGSDYNTPEALGGMKGRKVLISIQTVTRENGAGSYSTISSVCPVPAGYVQPTSAPAPVAPDPIVAEDLIPF